MQYITGSKLYSYIMCQHRVWRDVWGPQEEKIKDDNPFVKLLWERGVAHEENVVADLGELLDLSKVGWDSVATVTLQAMRDGAPLIYQGVLEHENLRGIPDLLKRLPDGSYLPIEIKSGMGYEAGTTDSESEDDEGGKPKKSYAVQLALYVDLLERLGFEHQNRGLIIDGHRNEIVYNLDKPLGKRDTRTMREFYQATKADAWLLMQNERQNKPAYSGKCKLCPWYTSCKNWVKASSDPTGLFYVGASMRDSLEEYLHIEKIEDILQIDVPAVLQRKEKEKGFLPGVAEKTLGKLMDRARVLLVDKKPVLYGELNLPVVTYELFFDIEDDPTQEFVYLHGVYERTPSGERFLDFTAKDNTPEAEQQAWQGFWDYIRSLPQDDFAVYYYSAHEKTTYRKLRREYPEVISEDELEGFFGNPNVIDLYNVVLKQTDWPLPSYSIKELAVYLGFQWRDVSPSGALSIQWFNEYLETKDEAILKRILEYNEDDCKATMVLKDGLAALSKNK
jgi:uncharacterized protein